MNWQPTRRALLLALPLAWGAPPPACAEPLGRLFFTPAERARLDKGQPEQTLRVTPPRLDGIITRSAGAPTLFLDGAAIPAAPRQIDLGSASARIVGADGRNHRLRVGEPPAAAKGP